MSDPAVCVLWNAIDAAPTDAELADAARRYGVVILNAWEVPAQRRLEELNPSITVLVYEDLPPPACSPVGAPSGRSWSAPAPTAGA